MELHMSVNKPNEHVADSTWKESEKNDPNQQRASNNTNGLNGAGLAELFNLPSMTSNGRNLKIVSDTLEQVAEIYKRVKNSSVSKIQLMTIPEVENITSSISPILPGGAFHREINGTVYIMGVLFSTKELAISSEYIRIGTPGNNNMNQTVSALLPPVNYANGDVVTALETHYKTRGIGKTTTNAAVINMVVIDLEMLTHSESADPKDRPHMLAEFLVNEWMEAILVKTVREMSANQTPLRQPFKLKDTPYGRDGIAEARITAISNRTNVAGVLTPANMEVVVSTMNANNGNSFNANSKEISRVTATVSLNAQAFEIYQQQLQAARASNQLEIMQRMIGTQGSIYPEGYRPLAPTITIESASAGEMMDYNQGLYPYFYSLYTLMTTNNNFAFSEALRKHVVGNRGNLAALEIRIDEMLARVGSPQNRVRLNDKNISDTDLVNQWIRQNVSPHATFQVNISLCGAHSSVQNFLLRLANDKNNTEETTTTVAVLDALSNNKASALIARNKETKTGWVPSMPILRRTPTVSINGLATRAGKALNTQELDEMMLCSIKGPNGGQAIQQFLALQYGATGEDIKVRNQKLRVELSQSIFDGAVHINSFNQTHIWDPRFMAFLGETLDSIGTLNAANTGGNFRNNNLVYAYGGGLATFATVGSGNPNNNNQGVNYTSGSSFG